MNSINVALIVFFAASVSAGTLKQSIPDCPLICPKLFDPICASNGNEARLFHSECHMKRTNCRDLTGKSEVFIPREMEQCTSVGQQKTYTETSNCRQTCPMLFKPICATNGKDTKIFDSECHMNMANCRNLFGKANHFMPCEFEKCQTDKVENQKSSLQSGHLLSQCPLICPQIYMPICAANGKEAKLFSSECHMLQANCIQLTKEKDIYTPREIELCGKVETTKPMTVNSISNIKIASVVQKTKCLRPCPMIYLPVCAFNGQSSRTFGNECMLDQHNCMTNEKWLLTRTEEC